MNREILFRGKRLDNGEWVTGRLITDGRDGKEFIVSEIGYHCEEEIDSANRYIECFGFEVEPETVGQYTGLKDKNSKKIFEGDVLYDDYWEVCGIVAFDDGGFRINICNLSEDLFEFTDCPIVGNKWDNPELLEVLGDEA